MVDYNRFVYRFIDVVVSYGCGFSVCCGEFCGIWFIVEFFRFVFVCIDSIVYIYILWFVLFRWIVFYKNREEK